MKKKTLQIEECNWGSRTEKHSSALIKITYYIVSKST